MGRKVFKFLGVLFIIANAMLTAALIYKVHKMDKIVAVNLVNSNIHWAKIKEHDVWIDTVGRHAGLATNSNFSMYNNHFEQNRQVDLIYKGVHNSN